MIRPTLFVGLGTTGTNILKYLRRLMFEEYGRAGLPGSVAGERDEILTRRVARFRPAGMEAEIDLYTLDRAPEAPAGEAS